MATMLLCVECNALTDERGKAVAGADPSRLTYRFVEAETAADAIRAIVAAENLELLGTLHHVADVQALATVRSGRRAMTLHAYPEEEAEWRQRIAR